MTVDHVLWFAAGATGALALVLVAIMALRDLAGRSKRPEREGAPLNVGDRPG